MIPNKAKNILLIPVTDGGVTQYFNMEGHPGYDPKKASHNGLDIGWCDHQYCDIIACQDGVVVQTRNNDSSIGNAVVLQHDYEDATRRFTAYIHLKDKPTLKKGASVKQGQKVGVRGGSPYVNGKQKYGTHLHLYVTSATTKAYTWNTLLKTVIDPYPLLYRSKAITYKTINSTLKNKPFIEDVIPEVVSPVERNEDANQLLEKTSKLRVRMKPSLTGNIIGFLQANAYYDFYETASADGYQWYKIADEQWCAQTGTMTIFPKKDANDTIERLTAELSTATQKAEKLARINDALLNRIAAIRNLTMEE